MVHPMGNGIDFFRDQLPDLFARGVALLRARAAGGDERAAAKLADIMGARGLGWLTLEGAGEVWLSVADGEMRHIDARTPGEPVRFALRVPGEAVDVALAALAGAVDLGSEKAALRAAGTASARLERAVGEAGLDFHLILQETPDFDEVLIEIALNREALPDKPTFTATVRWDDLAAMRASGMNLQQLFLSGKLRLGGDYSRAMQVGMQLMQPPR